MVLVCVLVVSSKQLWLLLFLFGLVQLYMRTDYREREKMKREREDEERERGGGEIRKRERVREEGHFLSLCERRGRESV